MRTFFTLFILFFCFLPGRGNNNFIIIGCVCVKEKIEHQKRIHKVKYANKMVHAGLILQHKSLPGVNALGQVSVKDYGRREILKDSEDQLTHKAA